MATLTVSVGFRGWASHHTQTGCQSPPPAQSLGTPAVSGCAPPPRSPTCSWRSWDSHRGSRGSLSSRWGCVACSCSSELRTGRRGETASGQVRHHKKRIQPRSTVITAKGGRITPSTLSFIVTIFPFIRPVSASVTAPNMQMRRSLTQGTTDRRGDRATSRLPVSYLQPLPMHKC